MQAALRELRGRVSLAAVHRALTRLDPCRDPEAERISAPFLVVFALAAACSVFILFAYEYEPGRDVGFHASVARIVAGRHDPTSYFHDRYAPFDPLKPNTLLYSAVAPLAQVIDPYTAFRVVRLEYFLGLPLVTLYALRRLGRSAWPALLVFPMEYTQAYVAGFVNFEFAAPFLVASVLAHWLFTEKPTVRRGLAVAACCVLVFLSHAHVYLWLGALLVPITLYGAAKHLFEPRADALKTRAACAGKGLVLAAACVLPSLLLFVRWYERFYGAQHAHPAAATAVAAKNVGLQWLSLEQKMSDLQWGTRVTKHLHEPAWPVATALLVVIALVLSQRDKRRSAPVFELCALATVASYFVLPDELTGQQIARRSWDMAAWFVPFLVTPVAARVSRWSRGIVIVGIAVLCFGRLRDIQAAVRRFNVDEVTGFDAMVAAAPHEDLLVAWAVGSIESPNVVWLPWYEWHQMFAARTGLEAPLYVSDKDTFASMPYAHGAPAPPTLMINEPNWGAHAGLWDRYDLVLVKDWHPDAAQVALVREHATLLAESHDWQLWRRIGPAPRLAF